MDMDTLFTVNVRTNDAGEIEVTLLNHAGRPISRVSRQFTVEDADEQWSWIDAQMKTATTAAVMSGEI